MSAAQDLRFGDCGNAQSPSVLDFGPILGSHALLTNFEGLEIGGLTRLQRDSSTYLLLVIGLPMAAPLELFSSILLDEAEGPAGSSPSASPTMRLRKRISNKTKDYSRKDSALGDKTL